MSVLRVNKVYAEVWSGDFVTAFNEAFDIACELDCQVYYQFNDVEIIVTKDDTLGDAWARYYRLRG